MKDKVQILRDPSDQIAQAGPVGWAVTQLCAALTDKGFGCNAVSANAMPGEGSGPVVIVASPTAVLAQNVLRSAGIALPSAAEALAIVPGHLAGRPTVLACGADPRGLVYAVTELADRVVHSSDPLGSLLGLRPLVEQPANPIRGIARLFVSDVEDKPWFYDHSFWQRYLGMLIGQRFNRFHLAFGLGYDFVRNVLDAYFLFPYPFFVAVPGYNVRVVGLPDAEREQNLETLRFITRQAASVGLQFELGLWMHAYEWVDSPRPNYTIAGLTPDSHAAYCRDALRMVLEACPDVACVSFRVHGESGVPEGSYDFWRTVFDGVVQVGRGIEINLHPKGVNQKMLEVALATGHPVTISPKFTAEHMGLPAHQASIREMERVGRREGGDAFFSRLMNMSEGSLRYTRYGYADFLKRDRRYGVFSRVWPGTDRLLLWGDPALAAGYGRFAGFCGSLGMELCEPLSFKGRLGSGLPGGRNAYADESLRPTYDFEKYLYSYRLYGRLLYNPDADADQWRRYLKAEFGQAAASVEQALGNASRILPLVTTAYMPSAHYGWFWPEMYTPLPIVNEKLPHHYRDTDEPKRVGNVSALDPVLFCKAEEFADEVVRGQRSGRYSPLRVAQWLDGFATEAKRNLAAAESTVADRSRPEFRRLAVDVTVESGLGRFFAAELRAAVAYALWQRTHELGRLREAVAEYRAARAAWMEVVEATRGVYRDDITFGLHPCVRGHWADRLPALDADLAAMEDELKQAEAAAQGKAANLAPLAMLDGEAPQVGCTHTPADAFRPGQPLEVQLTLAEESAQAHGITVRLHYRHVNQAESYEIAEMTRSGGVYRATIPAAYTDSPYALLYFFELSDAAGHAWLYPGFNATLNNQPYFVVQQG